MYELIGHQALVTGAAQGIGCGIAFELARAGCTVVIADLNSNRAKTAAEEISRETGRDAIGVVLDVTDPDSVRRCVQASIERFSRIDILVNNAGIHSERPGFPSSSSQFQRCFDVNLFGVWRMSQELVSHFKDHGGGKIVNIASINGRKPWADTPAYSASKAALINLTQSMAITFGAYNINVNAVCPGGVITPMAEALLEELELAKMQIIDERALKRDLLPEDIGHAVVFLASSRSRNITGQALNVDGGVVLS